MYSMFSGFSVRFRWKQSLIDNTTFRLHYRTTFAILAIASLLTTASQFIGSPIQCIVDGIPDRIMNTFCWIHGTFTIPAALTGRLQFPHPGVMPHPSPYPKLKTLPGDATDKTLLQVTEEGEEIRHAWYQWVCFVLFLQALMCYVPHYLWKAWEGGKLRMLIQDLDQPTLADAETLADRRKLIENYIVRSLRSHNSYVFKFIFCEMLNLVNILVQVYLMDVFLGGEFTTYGSDVLSVSEKAIEDRVDPMSKVFPKVTKCTFRNYGPSGTIEKKDGLCVLAVNIINEKIYIFLWFWFLTLIAWTSIHLLVRLTSLASKYCRLLLLCNRCKANNRSDVAVVMRKCYYGDWFILMQLAKHIDPRVFHELIIDLRDRLDPKRAANREEDDEYVPDTVEAQKPQKE